MQSHSKNENLEMKEHEIVRLESPQRDDYVGTLSVQLPSAELQDLAQIDGTRAVGAILAEWIAIVGAIGIGSHFWHPLLYLVIVLFMSGRQHALAVLQHDAAHFRLFPQRFWNDSIAEAFLAWPLFLSNQQFRQYHFLHHHYLGMEKDGNRIHYRTHTKEGKIAQMWLFPKRPLALVAWMFVRFCGIGGILYLFRSIYRFITQGSFRYLLLVLAYYGTILTTIYALHGERVFLLCWMFPLCTGFILTNLLRIAGEHSAIVNQDGFFQTTRTTIPSWFDQIFIVPRNISYHLEHHLYPYIPFYRLPELHHCLMKQANFREHAHITKSYWGVLQELTQKQLLQL
jgi:fatty acid desaturase